MEPEMILSNQSNSPKTTQLDAAYLPDLKMYFKVILIKPT
jgi:hypothetical protein